ncbi:uncharacterized protein LOC126841479 isoform X2 [Adelges cooleyi]|uniref:uncharacterized protein LOC126841479 isoform X2 n=1 Tax=Adelges cooleyi TaxID=133065 RepID=UPI00217F51DD|nr:uncharacterized protein LOC126841479 isoform X2 [Adelges cooleyi]
MAGVLFNILIPTERHETHLTLDAICDCSSKNKHSFNTKRPTYSENGNGKSSEMLHQQVSMEKALEAILSSLHISNSIWAESKDHKCYSITFSIASNEHCEHILDLFLENGIGIKWNSVVVVLPCSLYYQGPGTAHSTFEPNQSKSSSNTSNLYESSWKTFLQSVRSRLIIAQVVQGLESGARLTFDFLILLVISVMVAALGLTQGETTIFVASMLLSPLMGPVNAATFGTMIKDKKLRNMGIVNEIIGLVFCVIIGFGFGLTISYFDERDPSQWVTKEMLTMTDIRSLWVSIVLAFLTGIAVPIALLGNNTFSLVGVAISTSLLPPAVNAGLLWAFAVKNIGQTSNTINLQYSSFRSVDFAIKGAMSMCLTFINIICIFACGIVILKIKAVAPKKSSSAKPLISEYLEAFKDINYGLPEDETNYLTSRYNPFDLTFVTWSPGYKTQHSSQAYYSTHSDSRSAHLLKKKMKTLNPIHDNNSTGSLRNMFDSPTKRFVVTPVTLANTSDA